MIDVTAGTVADAVISLAQKFPRVGISTFRARDASAGSVGT